MVYIRDAFGTFTNPDEPSYDIMAFCEGEVCLFKHQAESMVTALSKEELAEYGEMLSKLAVMWGG